MSAYILSRVSSCLTRHKTKLGFQEDIVKIAPCVFLINVKLAPIPKNSLIYVNYQIKFINILISIVIVKI